MPINSTQQFLLDSYLEYTRDTLLSCGNYSIALLALEAVLDDKIYEENRTLLESQSVKSTVDELRKILKHEDPQNRTESYLNINAIPGYVAYRINDSEGKMIDIGFEKEGLLSLTAKSDPGQIITGEEVHARVTMRINDYKNYVKPLRHLQINLGKLIIDGLLYTDKENESQSLNAIRELIAINRHDPDCVHLIIKRITENFPNFAIDTSVGIAEANEKLLNEFAARLIKNVEEEKLREQRIGIIAQEIEALRRELKGVQGAVAEFKAKILQDFFLIDNIRGRELAIWNTICLVTTSQV